MTNLRVLDTRAASKKEVIEEAKRILELAEAGEITDLSWSASCRDGSFKTSFTSTEDAPRRLASASRLVHRLHLQMDDLE